MRPSAAGQTEPEPGEERARSRPKAPQAKSSSGVHEIAQIERQSQVVYWLVICGCLGLCLVIVAAILMK